MVDQFDLRPVAPFLLNNSLLACMRVCKLWRNQIYDIMDATVRRCQKCRAGQCLILSHVGRYSQARLKSMCKTIKSVGVLQVVKLMAMQPTPWRFFLKNPSLAVASYLLWSYRYRSWRNISHAIRHLNRSGLRPLVIRAAADIGFVEIVECFGVCVCFPVIIEHGHIEFTRQIALKYTRDAVIELSCGFLNFGYILKWVDVTPYIDVILSGSTPHIQLHLIRYLMSYGYKVPVKYLDAGLIQHLVRENQQIDAFQNYDAADIFEILKLTPREDILNVYAGTSVDRVKLILDLTHDTPGTPENGVRFLCQSRLKVLSLSQSVARR